MSKNKTRTKDKYRVVYNDTQRIELENEFRLNEYIAIPRKQEIAHKLQLSERQIKIWFQNRRAKKRKQQKRRQSAVSTTTATSTTTASPGTATPISIKHESVSPPYTSHQNNITSTSLNTTTNSLKGSPQLIVSDNRLHHQPESIYPSRFFNQPHPPPTSAQQQQAQICASQYYESATNYLTQEQEQYANVTCIQTNHQRQPFGPTWPATAPALPAEPVVSPELSSTSPPTASLGNQQFHHQSHHLHHHPQQHHQQSIQRYSHQNATNYSANQADGYGMTTTNQMASPMAQTMHRLHADSGSLHPHFISHPMPQGSTPLSHHHSTHLHAQHHNQHYHQPLTQVQSQNHLHHHHNQLGMSSSCNGAINI